MKAMKIGGLFWFELAGMSWSEFAAGTLRAQLGYFRVESGRLNLAKTRVRSVPGEGLEPSRGKPSQDFKSCASASNPKAHLDVKRPYRKVGLKDPTGGLLAVCRLYGQVDWPGPLKSCARFRPASKLNVSSSFTYLDRRKIRELVDKYKLFVTNRVNLAQTQNLARGDSRGGSTPPSGTNVFNGLGPYLKASNLSLI